MMTKHSPTVHFVRRPEVFFTIVDDELIIMEEEGERFLSSNAVATTVWTALETPVSLDMICDAVLAAFSDTDRVTVEADVGELLEALRERELIDAVATG